MAKTEIAAKQQTLPSTASDFEDNAGAGLENVRAGDLLVPRLTILQALSPQLNKKKSEFIEGAEVGDIVDVGTGEMFRHGVIFLPVYYRKDYLEWAPRSSGKGLVNVHHDPAILDRCSRDEKNRPITAEGNLISETAQFYGLNLSAGRRRCFLPMTSTQLKKARKWLNLATGERLKRADGSEFQAPMYYRTYDLSTNEESNNDGDWNGWVVARGAALPELDIGVSWKIIKHEAHEFYESMASGSVKGDVSGLDGSSGDSAEGRM